MNTQNRYAVAARGDGNIEIFNPPRELSKEDALVFAAWVVAQTEDGDAGFQKALKAVRSL